MLDPDKFKLPPYVAHAMDLAPMSPEEIALFQEIANEHCIKADDPMIQNVFEEVRNHMAEGTDQATIVIDSLPEGSTLVEVGKDNKVTIVGSSPRRGMSYERLQDVSVDRGDPMSEDERMEVATRARRGGKSALLLAQLAAMSMATMPELFKAGSVTGTTHTRVGGFLGGTGGYGSERYDSYEESKRLAKQIDEAEQAEIAIDKAEAKRQRRMKRNLKNVQRNS